MKKIILFICAFSALPVVLSAQTKNGKATITIQNTSKLKRTGAVTAVEWKSILSKFPGIDTGNFKVLNAAQKEVPFQLEYKGETSPQQLLVQLDVQPNASVKLSVVPGKAAKAVQKTFGRYVPERKDDFAWENDKVAFRMYGKALEATPKEMAYGVDIWGKRTTRMILNERYKKGEYHVDHGDGNDYYHVGLTLGGGDIAPYIKDKIYYPKNYRNWKIVDQGPLRFTFQLIYDNWDVEGRSVKVTKTISLDAGSHLNRVEASYQYDGTEDLPVVVGIIKRAEPGKLLLDEQQGIMGYWEPQHGADGITGVGTIVADPKLKMKVSNEQLLTQTSTKNGTAVVYYNGAAWNKAQEITSASAWFDYLNNFKQALEQPLKVTVQ
ncbi:DUF4861 family protein [Pedobacter caeni]|uniref:DUF4861 domain-containing protein n=1 Tax=Pedobacter caeni TaxID=288992 RepID=A0A1M5BRK4_9SPHI|nr:DUF4861 family protein [Pedobacter caeni]SHF44897.1 protein of unknown function [Pedobacter caeni]